MAHENLILAVASKGGHWEQMMLLRPAFDTMPVLWGTTDESLARREGLDRSVVLPDAHRGSIGQALRCAYAALRLVLRVRPRVVISTGALPGLMCVMIGRFTGARTIWVDSFANAEQLSMSGRVARHFVDRVYTQWEHLADPPSVTYRGSVL